MTISLQGPRARAAPRPRSRRTGRQGLAGRGLLQPEELLLLPGGVVGAPGLLVGLGQGEVQPRVLRGQAHRRLHGRHRLVDPAHRQERPAQGQVRGRHVRGELHRPLGHGQGVGAAAPLELGEGDLDHRHVVVRRHRELATERGEGGRGVVGQEVHARGRSGRWARRGSGRPAPPPPAGRSPSAARGPCGSPPDRRGAPSPSSSSGTSPGRSGRRSDDEAEGLDHRGAVVAVHREPVAGPRGPRRGRRPCSAGGRPGSLATEATSWFGIPMDRAFRRSASASSWSPVCAAQSPRSARARPLSGWASTTGAKCSAASSNRSVS